MTLTAALVIIGVEVWVFNALALINILFELKLLKDAEKAKVKDK